MKLLLIVVFFVSFSSIYGQEYPNKDRQVVLRHDKIGKTYTFDRSRKNDLDKTEIAYLGKLKTKDGRVFKILISKWFWGIVPRATSRIVVFNEKNQYLGNYYVGMTYDLPSRIENNELVFENKSRDGCDPDIVTRLSFNNGLPKEFFLECSDHLGDVFSFGND